MITQATDVRLTLPATAKVGDSCPAPDGCEGKLVLKNH